MSFYCAPCGRQTCSRTPANESLANLSNDSSGSTPARHLAKMTVCFLEKLNTLPSKVFALDQALAAKLCIAEIGQERHLVMMKIETISILILHRELP